MTEPDEPGAATTPPGDQPVGPEAEPPAADGSPSPIPPVAGLSMSSEPTTHDPPPQPTFAWTPELASGLQLGASPPATPRRRPLLDAVVWVVALAISVIFAIGIVGFRTRAAAPTSAFDSGRRVGEVLGTVVGALIMAFVLWGIVVFVSRRRGHPRRLTSPIVPLIAFLVLSISLVANATRPGAIAAIDGTPSATHSIDQVLAIGAPYHLENSPTDEEKQFLDLINGGSTNAFKSVVVRRVYRGSDLAGYAMVADAEVEPGQDAVALAGVELGLGTDVTKSRATLAGHNVISGIAGGAGYSVWVEPPFVKMVFASSEQDAKDIAARFASP